MAVNLEKEKRKHSSTPKLLYITRSGTACSAANMQKEDEHLEKQQLRKWTEILHLQC